MALGRCLHGCLCPRASAQPACAIYAILPWHVASLMVLNMQRAPVALVCGSVKVFVSDARFLHDTILELVQHAAPKGPAIFADAASELRNKFCLFDGTPHNNLRSATRSQGQALSSSSRTWSNQLNGAYKFARHVSSTKACGELAQVTLELAINSASSFFVSQKLVTPPPRRTLGTYRERAFPERPPGIWAPTVSLSASSGLASQPTECRTPRKRLGLAAFIASKTGRTSFPSFRSARPMIAAAAWVLL